jgi:hypothetical protein
MRRASSSSGGKGSPQIFMDLFFFYFYKGFLFLSRAVKESSLLVRSAVVGIYYAAQELQRGYGRKGWVSAFDLL